MNKNLSSVLQKYFEIFPDPAYIWRKVEKGFLLANLNNDALESLEGDKRKYVGMEASEFHKDHPAILNNILKCYQEKRNITKELKCKNKKSGETIFLKASFVYVPEDYVIVRSENITKEKKLEEQLKIAATKYRHLFDNSPFYIFLINKSWEIIDCNSTVKDILGYDKKEILGKNLIDLKLIDFDIIDKLKKRTHKLFEEKKLQPIEMKVKKRNGNPIWIQSYASLITYNNKNLIQLVGKDITARRRAEFQLKKSKQQSEELSNELRVIFDNVPALIYYKDTKNNLIRVNQKFAEQLNMSLEEIKGKNAFELFPKEMAEKYWNHDLRIIESGKPEINFIEPMTTPNGVKWMLNSKIPIKDKYGEVVGIIGFGSDITELKEAEKDLRVSERKFRKISESANDGIYFVNSNGIVTFWNKAAEEIFGYSKEEVIGNPLDEFIIPEERKKHFEENIRLLRETGKSPIMNTTKELTAITKDDEELDIAFSHSTIKIDNKWHAIAIVRDITKRKRIEESLRESEQLFRTIAERTDMGILILQNDGLVYMNEQFSEFFGYTKEQMSDWTIDDFPKCVHPDDLQFVVEQARKKQAGHKDIVDNYEFKGIKKSGEVIWLNVYSRTIQYKGDLADLVTLIDITERKKAELELKDSEQRYREAYELANLYKDLLAHDINNILQNIKSAIQLENMAIDSSKTFQNKKVNEYHDIIEEQISRGVQLISNVQKLTKLEEVQVNSKTVDLCDRLNESIEFVKNSFGRRKIEINVESFQKELKINANEFLSDVFENILINAVKYNEHDHVIIDIKISNETQKNTKYLKMEFIDNGIGISDENKDIIFKTGTIKGKGGKGMGFGLALVKKIIQNLQGSITVKNKVKNDYTKGSNFIVRLPFEN